MFENIKSKFTNFLQNNSKTIVINDSKIDIASIKKRFLSHIIDTIIVTLILLVITALFFYFAKNYITIDGINGGIAFKDMTTEDFEKIASSITNNNLYVILNIFIPICYYIACLASFKATIGQRVYNICVVSEDFSLSIFSIINRVCFFIFFKFSLLFLIFDYGFLFYNKKFALHDVLSNTKVVEINKVY